MSEILYEKKDRIATVTINRCCPDGQHPVEVVFDKKSEDATTPYFRPTVPPRRGMR